MMIASLGIVCQADAATRCAPDHVADRGASVAGLNAVGESVSLPDHISLHSDHISFNSDIESYCEYSGGYTYLNGTLERVETSVGNIHNSGVHLAYLKDYQGNVRAAVAGGMAVEFDDYYPYGMSMCIPWGDSAFQPMKYGSKTCNFL